MLASAIVTPTPTKKRRTGSVIRLQEQHQANNSAEPEQPRRSAIVEPKQKPTAMHPHLLDHDGSEAEQRHRGDLAGELFRKIARAASKRD